MLNMKDETFDNPILKSTFAYRILREIHDEEKYAKEIVEDLQENYGLDTSKQSVSNYLKSLRDLGFIKRGKRTRAQYYKIDYEGLYGYWLDFITWKLDSHLGAADRLQELIEKRVDELKESPEKQEHIKENFPVSPEDYIESLEKPKDMFFDRVQESYEIFDGEIKESEIVKEFFMRYSRLFFFVFEDKSIRSLTMDYLEKNLSKIKEMNKINVSDDLLKLEEIISVINLEEVIGGPIEGAITSINKE